MTTPTKGPIAWMVNNPITANLMMLALLLGGVFTLMTIKQEVFPDFEMDLVNVVVPYPGASPDEVEKGIVLVVEEALRGVDGVKKVTSSASEGNGRISAELLTTANRQRVYQDIQQEIDRIRTFPEEAEEPRVSLASRRRQVIGLVLYGDQTESVLRDVAEQVREELLQKPSITLVEMAGVRAREISISVPQSTLRAHNLTLQQVARTVAQASVELPGGGVKTTAGEILVRIRDRRDWGKEFARIPIISTETGKQLLLGDIANIEDGFEDTDYEASYDGKRAVSIEVYRIGKQKPIDIANAARAVVDTLKKELPAGIQIDVLRDRSDIFRQRALLLRKNGTIGLILVLLLLGTFLEARLALWVAMGIPISFLGGLIFLPMFGVSINMISMFAFLIALGIVVDDAIVVGENIYEHHQRGMPFLQAAVVGTREVSLPVNFSVLTNIVAFLPLFFVPGFIGKIWRVIPAVVVTVFAISLVECLYVLPSHLGHVRPRKRNRFAERLHQAQQRFSQGFMRGVQRVYGPFLDSVLTHRYIAVSCAVAALLVVIAYIRSDRMGIVPMPRVDADYSVVTAVLPYGSPVEKARAVRARLIASARQLGEEIKEDDPQDREEVTGIYAQIGGAFRGVSGAHVVSVRAYLAHPDRRPVDTRAFTMRWRKMTGEITGLEASTFESDRGGPGSGVALSLRLSHADTHTLDLVGAELADVLKTFPIVSDIDDGFTPGKKQFDFRILPTGLNLGMTSSEIARQVRNAYYGAEALRQQRGRSEIRVRARLPKNERISEHDIETLLLRTPAGTWVPLYEVAEVSRGRAYTSIEREDGKRIITVSANVTPPSESERILKTIMSEHFPRLQERYPGLGYSFAGRQLDLREGMTALKHGFLVAILMIYVLLAIPFRSYSQPLIVMISIPFGIVGAVIGHMVMGYDLSMISMMGIIALSGVVVNDSLVLIDYANRRRQDGNDARTAMHLAGVRRFRPIMLTTLTTFGGLAPMIFETSRQARFMIPMAISLGYGILFATLITLILVPSLYMISEDMRRVWLWMYPRQEMPDSATP